MILPTINLESELWGKGFVYVAGLDEVGRGPIAGPVVAGAVIITNKDQVIDGVRDSKKISEKRRIEYDSEIKRVSSAWGIGEASSDEIDSRGIAWAVSVAMQRAIEGIMKNFQFNPDILIIDGAGVRSINGYKDIKVNKGDVNHYSIAAASIIAKVYRDNLMTEFSDIYPNYGFEKHMGYGTKMHLEALNSLGPCPIHRKSFAPISKLVVNMR